MGFWGALTGMFAGPATATEIVKDVASGVDKAFFTDQEKAEYNQKMSDWYLKYLEATQPQNIARRWIAVLIVGVFLFLTVLSVCSWPFSKDYSTFIYSTLKDVLATPFSLILSFYFVKHIVMNSSVGASK